MLKQHGILFTEEFHPGLGHEFPADFEKSFIARAGIYFQGVRMSTYELPKAYDFKSTEARIYEMWEAGGYFKPLERPEQAGF